MRAVLCKKETARFWNPEKLFAIVLVFFFKKQKKDKKICRIVIICLFLHHPCK